MPVESSSDTDLRGYFELLLRRRRLIILTVLLFVNVTLALTLRQQLVYQAEAKVLLTPDMFGTRTNVQLDPALAVQTEIAVLESEPVRTVAVQRLGKVENVSAGRVAQTLIISVKARSTRPARAALIANTYAQAYIDVRTRLAAAPGDQGGTAALTSEGNAYTPPSTGVPRVLAQATAPTEPVQPKPVKSAILALILGVVVGIGLATLLEALDDSIKTKDELAARSGLPVLGVIPALPRRGGTLTPEGSRGAEAYRVLRTSLQLLAVDRPITILQITSPGKSEGKTSVVANLGVALARNGQRVVLVDGDLRRSRLHEPFGLSSRVGVTSVLAGKSSVSAALQPIPDVGTLSLLASGPVPPNPSELLSSRKMAELIRVLAAQFDVVLIDSPPVLAVTDATVITAHVEATVLVAAAGQTRRKHLAGTLDVLRQAGAPLKGAVLNFATRLEEMGVYDLYYGSDEARVYDEDGEDGAATFMPRRRRRDRAQASEEPEPEPVEDQGRYADAPGPELQRPTGSASDEWSRRRGLAGP